MFLNIENKKLTVKYYAEELELPDFIKEKIGKKWQEILKANPSLWDGDICCVTNIDIGEDQINLLCKKSKYSHYLYQERVGLPKEYECRNISAGSLLETKDGYFVFCELDDNTSFPTVLQVPGGNIDKKDVENDEIDCLKTITRETKEEVNIDINDENLVEYYKLNGFYTADEGVQPGVQVFAIVKLKITKSELEEHFEKYYKYLLETKGELEIKRLHYLHKENCIEEFEKLSNPKRGYLKGLLENNI